MARLRADFLTRALAMADNDLTDYRPRHAHIGASEAATILHDLRR